MNLITHLPFFMAGFGGYRIWQHIEFSQSRAGGILLGLSLFLCLIIVSSSVPLLIYLPRAVHLDLWALIFGALILSVCLVSITTLEHPAMRRCSELSFSLYLLHPVLMSILTKLQLVDSLSSWLTNEWPVFISASLITMSLLWGLSSITYRFIEVPGIAIGRRLVRVW